MPNHKKPFFLFLFTLLLTFLLAFPWVSAQEPPKPQPQSWQINGIVAALDDGHEKVKGYAWQHLAGYKSLNLQAVLNKPEDIAQKAATILRDKTVDSDSRGWAAYALSYLRQLDLNEVVIVLNNVYELNQSNFEKWRFLNYFLSGGTDEVKMLLKWVGNPRSLPTALNYQEGKKTLELFLQVWDNAQDLPQLQNDLAEKIAVVTRLVSWKPQDSDLLQRHYDNLNRVNLEFKRWRSQEVRRRLGGGERGVCSCCQQINVTPLLPQLPTHNEIPVELTIEANPTFLIYVDKIESDETMASLLLDNAFFALLDEERETVIYETEISLKDKIPGLISINLHETALTNPDSDKDLLEVDKTYFWVFIIPCEPDDWSYSPVTQGWVKRIAKEESLVQELAKTPEINHPKIYADYGIWTETVSSLVKLRERYPDNPRIQADWINLLESVGLDHLVAK